MSAPQATVGPREFRDALGGFATGVTVVTAAGADGPVGLTTNAVTSVSLEPAIFLVCFAASSRTLPVVREAGTLGVSVLRAGQRQMAERFAGKHDPAEKFHGVELEQLGGVPVLAGAAAAFVGQVDEFVVAGDHEVAFVRCSAVRHDPAAEPLIFHGGRFGRMQDGPGA